MTPAPASDAPCRQLPAGTRAAAPTPKKPGQPSPPALNTPHSQRETTPAPTTAPSPWSTVMQQPPTNPLDESGLCLLSLGMAPFIHCSYIRLTGRRRWWRSPGALDALHFEGPHGQAE